MRPTCASGDRTELAQLLEHVLRRRSCVAVQHGHIERQVKLILQPADGVPDQEILPATLGIAHDDGLFTSKPCFEEVPNFGTCLHQRWKNERSLHRFKRHVGPSDDVFVAYELSITELKIQKIFRVWEGLASPLANLTNKSVPQVSWEIASKAPAHSKKEISLRNNELLVFSNAFLLSRHPVSQDVPEHAKSWVSVAS